MAVDSKLGVRIGVGLLNPVNNSGVELLENLSERGGGVEILMEKLGVLLSI